MAYTVTQLGFMRPNDIPALNRLTRLAQRWLGATSSVISVPLVDEDRLVFASQAHLPDPVRVQGETPLSQSLCKTVMAENAPLIVENVFEDDHVTLNPTMEHLGVVAYLGVPVRDTKNKPIAVLSVLQSEPRVWSGDDRQALQDLAHSVSDHFELHASHVAIQDIHTRAKTYSDAKEQIFQTIMIPELSVYARIDLLLQRACRVLGFDEGMLVKVEGQHAEIIHSFNENAFDQKPKEALLEGSFAQCVLWGSQHLLFERDRLHFHDTRVTSQGILPGSYAGLPIVLQGNTYGVLEFSSEHRRHLTWNEEQKSLLDIVAMLVSVQLSHIQELAVLRKSEAALIDYMTDPSRGFTGKALPTDVDVFASRTMEKKG